MKKVLCLLIAVVVILNAFTVSFAADNETGNGQTAALESLDTSAIDGKLTAYIGVETYFVVYPEPLEAEDKFDVRNAVITCSKEGIVEAVADKNEEYRFGSVNITGLKLGKTTVTVTDPDSGVSCSVDVTVFPSIGYKLLSFLSFTEYIPYFLFMWIVNIFNR